MICSILSDVDSSEAFYNNDINYIKKSESGEMISYLPNKKHIDSIDPYTSPHRMEVKAGKFVNKMMTRECFLTFSIKDKDIERFVNLLKAESTKYDDSYFKIVEGRDINTYYSYKHYHSVENEHKGTLWTSCMRQDDKYDFFNLYSDSSKMLVLFDKNDKVMARALLWNATSADKSVDYKIMDRIYYYNDSDVILFKKWAAENGHISKFHQDAHTPFLFDIGGSPKELELQVLLERSSYDNYPYLDTFKFLCKKLKYLRNFERLGFTYKLIQTNGSPEPEVSEFEGENENYNDNHEYENADEEVEEEPFIF